MKLRTHQSLTPSGSEGRAPAALGMSLTKWLYYLVLLLLFAYMVYYVFDRVVNWKSVGIVATAVTPVAPSRDGRITEIGPRLGDTVAFGSPLFTVTPGVECEVPDPTPVTNLTIDLEMARARRVLLQPRIDELEHRSARLRERAALELGPEAARERGRVLEQIADLESEYALLGTEITVLSRAIDAAAARPVSVDPSCLPEVVRAPVDGAVQEVLEDPFTVVRAGQPVLSLRAADPEVRIVAEVDAELLESVFVGKRVDISFPDGSRGQGVIERLEAAADVVDALDLGSYSVPGSALVMEIAPMDVGSETAASWLGHDRLFVQLRGRKGRR